MKRYKRFMDGVRAPGTLDQRLKALKEPKKKPAWTKYGAMAAALVLVFGLGWYGLDYWQTMNRQRFLERAQVYHPEEVDNPNIALASPGEADQPVEKTLEGYEVKEERSGVPVVCYYCLPYIEYTQAGNPNRYTVAADWDIPQGALKGDLNRNHIARLLGGEDVLSTHLDWDGYELSGWAAWLENGDFWGFYIDGYAGELDHFEFAVTADQLPPTCIVHENSVTQEILGLTVTADKYDGEHGCDRRVSFMKGDYGYRFDLTSTDTEQAERLVSRLVRCVADERLALWTLDPKVETYTCPDCGEVFPVGDEKAHVHSFPGVGEPNWNDGAPAVSAEPGDSPRDRGENWCGTQGADTETCPECGETVPAGMSHDCAMCDGYPVPHICEICGYPLAPDTHVCEVCGQTIPAGVEHSHQQEHHSEHH